MKLAILGGGNIAKFHAKAMREAGFNIIAAASTKDSRKVNDFVAELGIPKSYDDPFELLASPNWDALLISIPTEQMLHYFEFLGHETRPILIEKPVSHNHESLLGLVHKKNIVVGYNRRHYESVRYVKNFIHNSVEPIFLRLCIPEAFSQEKDKLFKLPYNILENSVHIFDLARFFVGDITWHFVRRNGSQKNEFQYLVASGSSSSGALVHLDMPMEHPQNFSIDVFSGGERISMMPIEIMRHYQGMSVIEPSQDVPIRTYIPNTVHTSAEITADGQKPGFLQQAKAFHHFSLNGPAGVLATISDAIGALRLAEDLAC